MSISQSHKNILKKKFPDLNLDWIEIYMVPRIVSSNTYTRCFQHKVFRNELFLKKKFFFLFKISNSPLFSFVKKKMKLHSVFIFIVQTLEISKLIKVLSNRKFDASTLNTTGCCFRLFREKQYGKRDTS